MKEWFMKHAPRERLLLAGGGVLAAIIVGWWLIWTPLRGGAEDMRETVAEKQRLLADLRRAAVIEAPAAGGPASGARDRSLVVLVDSTAQSLGLAGTFTRTRPDGADAISVSFQNAPFGDLLEWLITLERSYGVSVESLSFNGTRAQGLVSGQIFLRRF